MTDDFVATLPSEHWRWAQRPNVSPHRDPGKTRVRRIEMTGTAPILGSLHSVDGEGVVRMEDRLDTGIDDLWGALTDPDRLARWYGEVEGDLRPGGEFDLHIRLGGPRKGRVEACEP